MRRAVVALALVGWAAWGCAPRYAERDPDAADPAEEPVVVGRVEADGTYRADTLSGDLPDTTRVERATVTTGTVRPVSPSTTTGWRVQVLADPDRASAQAFAGRIERLVDQPVYVEWAEPWWKVRVGDFLDRGAAERLRERLVSEGVEGAWTVRTAVRSDP
ncbi:MAG: SPOR domain-containing protein [Gemmatimonadetes bacterium]|nr:SPOR domain-containing protein [Gemmatimonadota bacterium]